MTMPLLPVEESNIWVPSCSLKELFAKTERDK